MRGEDDRELMARVVQGDRSAFSALVARHRDLVWRSVRYRVADDTVGEDVLQETFLAVWRGARSYGGEAPVTAWLRGVARQQAARTWRRHVGEPSTFDAVEDLGGPAGWGSQNPEQAAQRAEDSAAVRQALAHLPEEDRVAIELRDLEGLSGPEAAAELGVSLDALKSRLHRARLRLMAELRRTGVDRG